MVSQSRKANVGSQKRESIDKNIDNINKSKKIQQKQNDGNEVDVETAVLQILARKNRDRLFEEFEHSHSIKTKAEEAKRIDLLNYDTGKSKNYVKRKENYKSFIKRKKKKRQMNESKKLKLSNRNLDSMPLTSYGTFTPKENLPNDYSNVISIYQPHQLTWPLTMFYQTQQHNEKLLNGDNTNANFAHPSLVQNVFQNKANLSSITNNLEANSETGNDDCVSK